jgi:hypothetical protein
MTTDEFARGARSSTNLHLPDRGDVQVSDHGGFATLRVGDDAADLVLFARSPETARRVADGATVWAELTEAREQGEDVPLWGSWVLPTDTFRGSQ